MSPAQVLTTIQNLLPRIKSAGKAEPILLEYAREHNLAPAQLVKMAWTLNTCRSLSWMENNPNARGATVPLIDTEKLKEDYTTPAAKTATVKVAAATTPASTIKVHANVPNFFRDEAPAVKMAFSDAPENPRESTLGERNGHAVNDRYVETLNFDTLRGIRDDLVEDFAKKASTIKDRLMDNPELIPALFCDLSKSASATVPRVMAHVRKQISGYDATKQFTRDLDQVIAKYAAAPRFLVGDRTGMNTDVEQAADCLHMLDTCQEMLKSAAPNMPVDQDTPSARDSGGKKNTEQKMTGADARDRGLNTSPRPTGPSGGKQKAGTKGDVSVEYLGGAGVGGKGKKPENKTDVIAAIGTAIGNMAAKVPGPAEVVDHMTGPREPGLLKGLLGNHLSPGVRQRKIDQGVHDVQKVTNLQRMMLTDPILSEAEPEKLVGLFNDLQQSDPTIGHDPNRLRFALREALTYGGIPAQTSKTLAEIHKNKAQAEGLSRENREALYQT